MDAEKEEYVMDKGGKENSCFPSPKPPSLALLDTNKKIPMSADIGKGLRSLTPQTFEKV